MSYQITNTKNSETLYKSYLVFGQTKTGKTKLVASLPEGQVLFLNTENNIDSIDGANVNKIDCFDEKTFTSVIDDIISRKITPQWLYVDSITDLMQKIFNDIFKSTKDGRQAYQSFEIKYIEIMDKIKKLPCNVVCIAQQGSVKDDITGGVIFGPTLTWAKLQGNLPYRFSAVLATRVIKDNEGKDSFWIQCHPCPQYAVGVRTKHGKPNPLNQFEAPDILAIHNKIIN